MVLNFQLIDVVRVESWQYRKDTACRDAQRGCIVRQRMCLQDGLYKVYSKVRVSGERDQ